MNLNYLFKNFFSAASRISISCFLHGDDGCYTKCNLQCTLYDCKPRTSGCGEDFHCGCDEVYEFGSDQLTQSDFEFLDFNDLWNKTFESSIWSTDIRKLIRADKKLESYVLGLLRNPHVSGDDIKSLLDDKYGWSDLYFLKSNQHFVKTKLIGAGKPLKYNDFNDHIEELNQLMEIKPVDNVAKVKHRRRIRKFLQSINNIDDLEELLHLIKLSGNKQLYQLAKSVLKNLGYGFEEDGEKAGAKGLLRNIAGELADADEDELMDIATLNKFMTPAAIIYEDKKGSAVADKLYQSGDLSSTKIITNQQPVSMVGNLEYEQSGVSAQPLSLISSNNVPGLNGPILPTMTVLGNNESASYFSQVPATENSGFTTAFTGNIQNIIPSLNNIGQVLSSGQAISSSGAQKGDSGHKLYYIVVDEKGKVSQANLVPKIPLMIPGNTAISPPPQRISPSQETTLSNNSQGNTSSWYSLPSYSFGSVLSYTSNATGLGGGGGGNGSGGGGGGGIFGGGGGGGAGGGGGGGGGLFGIGGGGGGGGIGGTGGGGGFWSSSSCTNNNNNNNN